MTDTVNTLHTWNEDKLLERYHIFSYNYFIELRPILLNHLKKLYALYNIDLRSRFIPLAIYSTTEDMKKEKIAKEIEYIKTDLLEYPYFLKGASDLSLITFELFQKHPYKLSVFLLEEDRKRFAKEKIKKYSDLFAEISDYAFQYFLNMKFSITTLDKVILSLKIENSLDLHKLPCLFSAFIQYILYQENCKGCAISSTTVSTDSCTR